MGAPAAIGLLLAVSFWRHWLPDAILSVRIDLGNLALFTGLVVTAWLGLERVARIQAEQRQKRLLNEMQANLGSERRSFMRRLDHETKNPLMAMRAGLANLAGTSLDAGQSEILASVEAQTLRLSRLVADLRKLADLENRPVDRSPVDFADLLQEALAAARERPEAAVRRLTLTLPQAPWPLPHILGDRDLLFVMVYNLLDNALKFTRPGDMLELRAAEDGAGVVVEVADTGPGIPPTEVNMIWEELYRGQSARGVPGSGLGLALVRAIAERHNGQATLRSRPGQGTVFTVHLPLK